MSRSKKSRKPGVGSSGLPKPKLDKKTLAQTTDKKPKKKNGKTAGNRQLEAKDNKVGQQQNTQARDPRLGSKKPIVLTKDSIPQTEIAKPKQQKPIAAVRKIEPSDSLPIRLAAIEEDEHLLAIIAKQEENIGLNEEEIDYFNKLMDEHAKISNILGIDEEDDVEEDTKPRKDLSEEDLWDKLDSSDFSKFNSDIEE